MFRSTIVLLLLPLFSFAQPKSSPGRADLSKLYAQAIRDFIKASNKKNSVVFDTLFIAKRKNGQPDDFPDIQLPTKIEKAVIVLVAPEVYKNQISNNSAKTMSRVYVNLMGWVDKEKAEFLFVVFSKGFEHQYDYSIRYSYNAARKIFDSPEIEFKGPPFK